MRRQEPDPADEFFDIVDIHGNPTGEIKRRADVHRDGEWHRAFHCWVAVRDENGEPGVLFQRRSMNKDTYPGHLDVAVGGHFRAGEGFEDVVREMEEELGIVPPRDSLFGVGRRWAEAVTDRWIDREIEDVYVYCLKDDVPILRPSYEEITAVDVISLDAIESLFEERTRSVPSRRFLVQPDNTLQPELMSAVTLDDFIPVRDSYWQSGSRAAVAVLEGNYDVRLEL
jgi:isopentenyldiphosphate isomerase